MTLTETDSPAVISDLSASAHSSIEGAVALNWTAPGDDGWLNDNLAGYYEIKYATYDYSVAGSSLSWWNGISLTQTVYSGTAVSSSSALGSLESRILTGLYPAATYYFVMASVDTSGVESSNTNAVSKTIQ